MRIPAAIVIAIWLATPARAAGVAPARPAPPAALAGVQATFKLPMLAPLPRVLRAGDVIDLAWSGVPDDARELEVLLSVDGGATFPLRITTEMDVRRGHASWRVPNLPVESARLRLRIGTPAGELVAAPGGCFRIVADPRVPLDLDLLHEGAWWAGPRDLTPLGIALDATPALGALDPLMLAADAPPRGACGTPRAFLARAIAATTPAPPFLPVTTHTCRPGTVPLRI
jgi:hypothetical protein